MMHQARVTMMLDASSGRCNDGHHTCYLYTSVSSENAPESAEVTPSQRLVPSARQEGAHSYPGWVIQRPLATSLQLNRRCFRRGHSPFFARPLAIPCGNFPSASFHPGAATRSRIYASRCPSGFESSSCSSYWRVQSPRNSD